MRDIHVRLRSRSSRAVCVRSFPLQIQYSAFSWYFSELLCTSILILNIYFPWGEVNRRGGPSEPLVTSVAEPVFGVNHMKLPARRHSSPARPAASAAALRWSWPAPGADVAVNDRAASPEAEAVVAEIAALGRRAVLVEGDVFERVLLRVGGEPRGRGSGTDRHPRQQPRLFAARRLPRLRSRALRAGPEGDARAAGST